MINRDAWLQAVKEAAEAPLPETTAMSVQELADQLGICRESMHRKLIALVANGKARKTTKRIRRIDGMAITVTAYDLVS